MGQEFFSRRPPSPPPCGRCADEEEEEPSSAAMRRRGAGQGSRCGAPTTRNASTAVDVKSDAVLNDFGCMIGGIVAGAGPGGGGGWNEWKLSSALARSIRRWERAEVEVYSFGAGRAGRAE